MTERTGASATLKYARISPRKVKVVLDLIRNKPVSMAAGILNNTPKAASELLIKLLNSAVANAEKRGIFRVDYGRYAAFCRSNQPWQRLRLGA